MHRPPRASQPHLQHARRVLIALAASRLPALYEHKAYIQDGGLMAYGPSLPDMYQRAASYVDRILKGRSRVICQ